MTEVFEHINSSIFLSLLISALPSYLIGSLSAARLVNYIATGRSAFERFAEPVPHSTETFESDLVSATTVTKHLGAKFGCITSIIDMIKVALPTLLIKLLLPAYPFFLLTAITGIAGHNYPVYHRFTGGRGESPLIGALAVINWYGLIISNIAALVAGFITGSVLVIRWGGYFFMIFWFWYYFGNIWYVIFMIAANLLFYTAMRKDLAKFSDLKKEKGIKFTEEDVSEFILMGKGLGRALDNYSLYAVAKRIIYGKNNIR